MKRASFAVIAVAVSAAIGFAQSKYPPPFPRAGVRKAFENERVVVWKGLVGFKGRPTVMHEHMMDEVAVFLDDGGRTRITLPDGTTRESATASTRGGVAFQPKLTHIEEALVDGIRAVAIELKDVRVTPVTTAVAVPPAFPRDGAVLRLDNARVAMWEYQWTAERTIPLHSQTRDAVIVPLETGRVRFTTAAGEAKIVDLTFAEPVFLPRSSTVKEEVVEGTPKAIVVELK